MNRKLLILLLMIGIMFSTTVEARAFSDVQDNTEVGRAIKLYTEQGIINGFLDGTFRPNTSMTRSQAAKILVGALQISTEDLHEVYFTDVPQTHPNYKYISALARAGIVSGYKGKYNPSSSVTRAQIAKMLVEGVNLPINPEIENRTYFADVPITNAQSPYVNTLYKAGYVKGIAPSYYGPGRPVTRGQFMLMLFRLQHDLVVTENKSEIELKYKELFSVTLKDGNTAYAIQTEAGYVEKEEYLSLMAEEGDDIYHGVIEWYILEKGQDIGYLAGRTQPLTINVTRNQKADHHLKFDDGDYLVFYEYFAVNDYLAHAFMYKDGYMVDLSAFWINAMKAKVYQGTYLQFYEYSNSTFKWTFTTLKWQPQNNQFFLVKRQSFDFSHPQAQQWVENWSNPGFHLPF